MARKHILAGRLAFCARTPMVRALVGMARNARSRIGHGKAHVIHTNGSHVYATACNSSKRLLAEVRNSPVSTAFVRYAGEKLAPCRQTREPG